MDGKIANPYVRTRFTCRYDLERLFKARDEVDATIVGAQTVIDVDGTYTPKSGKQILRVLIDGAFRVPLESKFFASPAPALVAVTEKAPRSKIELAKKAGIEVMEFNGQVDIEALLGKLGERGIRKVLVEGGGVVFWQCLTHLTLIQPLQYLPRVNPVPTPINPLHSVLSPSLPVEVWFIVTTAGRPILLSPLSPPTIK